MIARPPQLDLFERLIPPKGKVCSQSLEYWDLLPKFVFGPIVDPDTGVGILDPRNVRYLPTQRRTCIIDNQLVTVEIAPARLKDTKGVERDFFPGLREQMVEQAIRRIAIDQHRTTESSHACHGRLLGTHFTLGEVCSDLARQNHTYSWAQVRHALRICNMATITLDMGGGTSLLSSAIFPVTVVPSTSDRRAMVQFHVLVTQAVDALLFRQIDYEVSMRLRSAAARWLHRRMTHRYRQASHHDDGYNIRASTIIRDSGLFTTSDKTKCRYQLAAVDAVMDDLRSAGVLMTRLPDGWRKEIWEGRKKVDIKYLLRPSSDFIESQKLANLAGAGRI